MADMVTTMPIEPALPLPLLRLLQLVSPSLPVGAFTYSQGLEWAVEAGWIRAADDVDGWLDDQLGQALVPVDLAILARMQAAAVAGDQAALSRWIDQLLAMRETAELRAEEANRGRALADLLAGLGLFDEDHRGARQGRGPDPDWRAVLARSQLAGFGFAAAHWNVAPRAALLGYAWGWLENLVLAAVKIVPLGQTRGQQLLARLAGQIPAAVDRALVLADDELGAASAALAIASSSHEIQYTRLYRS